MSSSISRIVMAGLALAALGAVQASAATGDDASADTRGRAMHASKCLLTMGFGGGCDKDEAYQKPARAERTADPSTDPSTRVRFLHASKCLTTLGFGGGCNGDAPGAPASAAGARPEAEAKAPDTSTRGRAMHASKCLMTFGFGGGCNDK